MSICVTKRLEIYDEDERDSIYVTVEDYDIIEIKLGEAFMDGNGGVGINKEVAKALAKAILEVCDD